MDFGSGGSATNAGLAKNFFLFLNLCVFAPLREILLVFSNALDLWPIRGKARASLCNLTSIESCYAKTKSRAG